MGTTAATASAAWSDGPRCPPSGARPSVVGKHIAAAAAIGGRWWSVDAGRRAGDKEGAGSGGGGAGRGAGDKEGAGSGERGAGQSPAPRSRLPAHFLSNPNSVAIVSSTSG